MSGAKKIVIGKGDDYQDVISNPSYKTVNIGETTDDQITLYYKPETEQEAYDAEMYVLTPIGSKEKIAFDDNDRSGRDMEQEEPEPGCGFFADCGNATTINLNNIDTSNVTDMSAMFSCCSSLTNIESLSKLKTDNVIDMNNMFDRCSSLKSLDLSNFNVKNVKNMASIFYDLNLLESIDLSHFDTSNVIDMSGMFYGCSSLTSLDVSKLNTSKVKDMSSMFEGLNVNLDLTNFYTGEAIEMASMFANLGENVKTLDLSSFDTSKVTDMWQMFRYSDNLEKIIVSNGFDTSKVEGDYSDDMFDGCEKLEGGQGTKYNDDNPKDKTYARIDGGPSSSSPGYFTSK